MASVPLNQPGAAQTGPSLLGCVESHGSESHPYVGSAQLRSGPHATRNLADAIHLLCALHGRQPGLIELVASRNVDPAARAWLNQAAEDFARERTFLAQLAVAAGPQPATPGTGSEATLAMQRNAILTLGHSERRGCAIGAALALAADWAVIRNPLEVAATRFSIEPPQPWAGTVEAALNVAEQVASAPAVSRAMMFGAEQVALQHRGLWDLLQARAEARLA